MDLPALREKCLLQLLSTISPWAWYGIASDSRRVSYFGTAEQTNFVILILKNGVSDEAKSDGAQALLPEQYQQISHQMRLMAALLGKTISPLAAAASKLNHSPKNTPQPPTEALA